MTDAKRWNPGTLMQLSTGCWASCALHAALRVGITQALCERADGTTAKELAALLKCQERGMAAVLDALTSVEVCVKENDRYRLHPDVVPFLKPGAPADQTSIIRHHGDLIEKWARLDAVVRNGLPPEWLAREVDFTPEQARNYYQGMSNLARQQAGGLARRLGLKPGQRVLDLGGSHGVYAYTFADETPGLKATVVDLAGAQPFFKEEGKRHAQAGNVNFHVGDFNRTPLDLGGKYDAAWLSQILHVKSLEAAGALIRIVAEALNPGGRLWVQEFFLEDNRAAPPFSALFHVNMVVMTPEARGYSKGELRDIMTAAGLCNIAFEGPSHPGSPAGLMKGEKPA